MSSPFVWSHHDGIRANETKAFLDLLLNFQWSEGPGAMTTLATSEGHLAALGSKEDRHEDREQWVHFVAVDDVDTSAKRAVDLEASLEREKSRGPAVEFTVIRNPGGAALAL